MKKVLVTVLRNFFHMKSSSFSSFFWSQCSNSSKFESFTTLFGNLLRKSLMSWFRISTVSSLFIFQAMLTLRMLQHSCRAAKEDMLSVSTLFLSNPLSNSTTSESIFCYLGFLLVLELKQDLKLSVMILRSKTGFLWEFLYFCSSFFSASSTYTSLKAFSSVLRKASLKVS